MRMRIVPVAYVGRWSGLVLLAGITASACDPTNAAPPPARPDPTASRCEAVPVVVLLLDKSRSAPTSLVMQLAPHDLDPLIELLRQCGGELAVGAIRDRPATSLVRLFIQAPPHAPVREEVPRVGNPMILREQRARAQHAYQEQMAEYEALSRRWSSAAEVAVEEFRKDVHAVIEEPTTAPATDIWAALRQADLFLSEFRDIRASDADSRGTTALPMRYVLVALTDGIHTAGGTVHSLQSTPDVFVVNSTGEVGVLARMNPRRFESFGAVLRAIAGNRATRITGGEFRPRG